MTDTTEPLGVVARLKARKAELEKAGQGSVALPMSGITVTFPRFKNHGRWQAAQRKAKRDVSRTQTIYLVDVCRFDGEKLTLTDYDELMPLEDTWELIAAVFGDDDDQDAEGNVLN